MTLVLLPGLHTHVYTYVHQPRCGISPEGPSELGLCTSFTNQENAPQVCPKDNLVGAFLFQVRSRLPK